MSLWTIGELMHLTRDELCDLAHRLEQGLDQLDAGTLARSLTLSSLENIRRVMLMRGLHC